MGASKSSSWPQDISKPLQPVEITHEKHSPWLCLKHASRSQTNVFTNYPFVLFPLLVTSPNLYWRHKKTGVKMVTNEATQVQLYNAFQAWSSIGLVSRGWHACLLVLWSIIPTDEDLKHWPELSGQHSLNWVGTWRWPSGYMPHFPLSYHDCLQEYGASVNS